MFCTLYARESAVTQGAASHRVLMAKLTQLHDAITTYRLTLNWVKSSEVTNAL